MTLRFELGDPDLNPSSAVHVLVGLAGNTDISALALEFPHSFAALARYDVVGLDDLPRRVVGWVDCADRDALLPAEYAAAAWDVLAEMKATA